VTETAAAAERPTGRGRRARSTTTRAASPKRDGSERWELLVRAAVQLFHEKGYTATSIQDLADATGITKGSVYHYIETKEDLLYEIVRRSLEMRSSLLIEPDAGAGAEQRLREFIQRWMAVGTQSSTLSQVAERELRWLTPRRLRAVISQRDKFSQYVKAIIGDGIAEGSFAPTMDPSLATNTLFGVLRNIPTWYRPNGSMSYDDVVSWNIDFLLNGLRTR